MNKITTGCVVFTLCAALAVFADAPWRQGEREPLWPSLERMPDRQTDQIGAMDDEVWEGSFWDKNRKYRADYRPDDHRMPYIEWFAAPTNANGCCMILVSGGSYQHCCDLSGIGWGKPPFRLSNHQNTSLHDVSDLSTFSARPILPFSVHFSAQGPTDHVAAELWYNRVMSFEKQKTRLEYFIACVGEFARKCNLPTPEAFAYLDRYHAWISL